MPNELEIDGSPAPSPPDSPVLSSTRSSSPEPLNLHNLIDVSLPDPFDAPACTSLSDLPERSFSHEFQMSSSPPISSPAKIFTSSPLASSQSSMYAPSIDGPSKVS